MLNCLVKSSLRATFFLSALFPLCGQGQNLADEINSIHGNFQVDAQYYSPDSLIGAPKVPEKMLSNAWGNINYIRGKFSAGVRYEAYNNVMQGFDTRYRGQGITNRWARYQDNLFDITAGNIYEQFGSGLLLRTYFEPGLLFDNSLDGFRLISNPYKGITLKGLVGRQRSFFALGPGIVRGFDGEINVNELFDSLTAGLKTRFIVGGGLVSKYQIDENPYLHLPQNVAAYGGRVSIIREGFNFFGEYVTKENDPSADNLNVVEGVNYYSYKRGEALFLSGSYATRGFSFLLQLKRIDNMGYRSDRDASLQNLLINYLPATTRQHTYLMPAFNPYATQPRGEAGGMAEMQFKVKKGSLLGGKYGTDVTINYSHATGIRQTGVNDSTSTLKLYTTEWNKLDEATDPADFFARLCKDPGEDYYHDFFVEITRKINPKWKLNFMYANQFYNRNVVQFGSRNAGYDNILANIVVVDLTWKYASNSALRFESQGYFTENKKNPNAGSWTTNMIEWTPSTHFFVAVLDQYNFDNPERESIVKVGTKRNASLRDAGLNSLADDLLFHYPLLSAGYTTGAHRISLSVGKQRAGIFCVGGVCRNVPASNGVALSITSSF
jgi:hypothetical protein